MMPMLPYPPYTKPDAAENSLLRVLGGVLAFLSILLTLLAIILHQRVPDLILAIIVAMFALRVLLLWLADKPPHQQPAPGWSSMDPLRYPLPSPPSPPGQPAASASPYSQSQPLSQLALEQHTQQSVPLPSTAASQSTGGSGSTRSTTSSSAANTSITASLSLSATRMGWRELDA